MPAIVDGSASWLAALGLVVDVWNVRLYLDDHIRGNLHSATLPVTGDIP